METPTYIVTKDLASTLVHRCGIGEVESNEGLRNRIAALEVSFIEKFATLVPKGKEMIILPIEEIADAVKLRIMSIPTGNKGMVVTLDPLFLKDADAILSITRQMNPDTRINKMGSRYGTPDVDEQIREIEMKLAARDRKAEGITLVDIGSFSGTTLKELVRMLKTRGIHVRAIILGLSSEKVKDTLRKASEGIGVYVTHQRDFFEWLELRDLFLIDGRNVPREYNNGENRGFIPYTENLAEWASIPDNNIQDCIRLCRRYNAELLTVLKETGSDTSRIGVHIPLRGQSTRVRVGI